jgi:Leucine-rich repeat (LRR) protein
MISGRKDMPLGPIPEDRSRASASHDNSSETPVAAVPPRVKKGKTKKKSATKIITKYDESGNPIGEKKIKVDEFGIPIRKKKTKSTKRNAEPTSSTEPAPPPVPQAPPKHPDPPASSAPKRTEVPSLSGPGPQQEMPSSADSISTMGQMSAAEVVRQSYHRPSRLPSQQQVRHQQLLLKSDLQQQQQHQQGGGGIDYNASFTDSKRSASTGRSSNQPPGPPSNRSRPTGSLGQPSIGGSNMGPAEAHGEDDGFGPVLSNRDYRQGNNLAPLQADAQQLRPPAAVAMPPHASSAVAQQSKSDTHDLVVQYMISTGADPAVAEQLACEFEAAQQRGIDNYAAAAKLSNNPDERKKHDVDKFAMFAENDEEGSVASGIVRALAQGAARAEREQNEYSQSAPLGPVATGLYSGTSTHRPPAAAAYSASRLPPPGTAGWGPPPVAAAASAWGPPPAAVASAWGPPPGVPPRIAPAAARTYGIPVGPRTPGTPEENPDSIRALLIQYLLSVGTDPRVAEQMADQFNQQQAAPPTAPRYQPQQGLGNGQHAERPAFHNKHLEAMSGGYSLRQSAPGFDASVSLADRRPMSQSMPARNPQWPRAERPGAVEMEGRAFGAPRRPQDISGTPEVEELEMEREIAENPFIIEATPVKENDYNGQVVYAESATIGMKYILQARPVRRLLAMICVIIVAVTVAATVVALKSSNKGAKPFVAETASPTGTPTSAPSFIGDDIEQAAAAISGFGSVLTQDSPQRRAVGWLSSKDNFDTQGFGWLFSQRYVLIVLYYATNGEHWLEQDRWMSPTLHVCDWSASIVCGADLTRRRVVTGIDLTRNGLSGHIPNEVGLLEGLVLLRLARNAINGTIPDSISTSTNLALLDLSVNQLSGTVPIGIGSLKNLLSLELYENALTGQIPSSTYDLSLLEKFDFSKNKFTGPLSQDITKLLSLGSLNLRNNELTGRIPAFNVLTNLDFILLDNNRFTGSLPNLPKDIINRLEFGLSHNRLSGRLPSVADVNVAEFLDVEFTIQRLDLSYNQLTGTIDPLMARIPTIRYVDLSGNSFIGPVPAQALTSGWAALEHFGASHNQFTGTVPLGFTSLLTSLDVSGNRLTGGIPLELYTKFPKLEYLVLSNNPLGGRLSGLLGELVALRDLHMNNCSLTGILPENIRALTSLDHFDFQSNRIGGTIPSSFGALGILRALELQNNKLTGTLPVELGSLGLLNIFNVANNMLTGELPTGVGYLLKLVEFDVSGNLFVGDVPQALCSNLQITRSMVGCSVMCNCCSDNGTDVCAANVASGLARSRVFF